MLDVMVLIWCAPMDSSVMCIQSWLHMSRIIQNSVSSHAVRRIFVPSAVLSQIVEESLLIPCFETLYAPSQFLNTRKQDVECHISNRKGFELFTTLSGQTFHTAISSSA